MSIYEEALIEAKKLKEIAEEDAKRAIVEEITPHIRKMISNQLAGKTSHLFEEEDKQNVLASAEPAGAAAVGGVSPEAPVAPMASATDAAPVAPMGEPAPSVTGGAMDAPIKATGADALNMPMPGPDGKLVVDFDDLFVPAEPGDEAAAGDEGAASAALPPEPPGGMPSNEPVDVNPTPGSDDAASTPTPGAPEGGPAEEPVQLETYEMFSEALDAAASRVHRVYSKGAPSLVKEALQEKLFTLCESLESLTASKKISPKMSRIFENRLEILHLKLKEAVSGNTYYRTEDDTDMASKSLKEYAAKILNESETVEGGPVTSPADVHKTEKAMKVDNAQDKGADKAGAHAQKVTEPEVTLKTEAAELAKLEEELKALIAESEGESLSADDGKQNLAGAASSIPDKKVGEVDVTKSTSADGTNVASHVQGVSENIEHSKETGSEEEVGKSSTGHPVKEGVAVSKKALAEQTKKLKAENLKKQIAALQEQLKECGGMGMEMEEDGMGGGAMPGAATGGASMPSTPTMNEEDTVINFNFDLADLVPELQGLGDDDEIEIDDDDEPKEPAPGAVPSMGAADHKAEEPGAAVGAGLSHDDDEEEGDKGHELMAENKSLKAQLAEAQLFNAKSVHVQPFLNNKNLTKEQKQKIVEYLDRGKTIDEVKTIYSKIKTVVEKVQTRTAKAGSSSKVSGAGAANLKESAEKSVDLFEGAVLNDAERNRLMELAGIKRK